MRSPPRCQGRACGESLPQIADVERERLVGEREGEERLSAGGHASQVRRDGRGEEDVPKIDDGGRRDDSDCLACLISDSVMNWPAPAKAVAEQVTA